MFQPILNNVHLWSGRIQVRGVGDFSRMLAAEVIFVAEQFALERSKAAL